MHTIICVPFDVKSFNEERYFITFIDDHSRNDYIYLLHYKSQAVNALEIYIDELERNLDMNMKLSSKIEVISKYYVRFDESGQHSSPFAKFLER
jgi:hypothetical protein